MMDFYFLLIIDKPFYNYCVKPLVLYQRNLIFNVMTIKIRFFDNFQAQITAHQVTSTMHCKSPQINITDESIW